MAKITELQPDPSNYNKHTQYGMSLLEKSIRKFGFVEAGLISEDDVICSGNARQETAVNIGMEDVQIIDIDGTKPIYLRKKGLKSGSQEFKELGLALNAVGKANVVFDAELIEAELGIAVCEEWGIETSTKIEAEEDDFDVPDGGSETDIVLGDLFEIGPHRLLCGDSTDSDAVARLMNGQKADMVFTDPPYGVKAVGGNGKIGGDNLAKNGVYDEIIGDDTTDTAQEFYDTCISLGIENFILWGGNYFTDFLPSKACWIIWDKRGDMNSNNFGDGEIAWTSFNSPIRIKKQIWSGMIKEGESGKRVHPTQKPVKLCAELIQEYSKGNNIFDGFGGSGSTMVACHEINKNCFMVEMSAKYVQTILDRMLKLDPSIIIKKNGEPYTPANA